MIPEKANIFIQSMVPQLTELTFYYMNLVTVSRVQRNPTVKAETQMRNFEASIPVGFFCYPISQAADITAFNATTVPVGEDQMPMLEQYQRDRAQVQYGLRRDADDAADFTSGQRGLHATARYRRQGEDEQVARQLHLSCGDPEDVVRRRSCPCSPIRTTSVSQDPGKLEGNTVFTYLDAFCTDRSTSQNILPDYAEPG